MNKNLIIWELIADTFVCLLIKILGREVCAREIQKILIHRDWSCMMKMEDFDFSGNNKVISFLNLKGKILTPFWIKNKIKLNRLEKVFYE